MFVFVLSFCHDVTAAWNQYYNKKSELILIRRATTSL